MKVAIKSFDVEMHLKNKGIEFEIYDNQGSHLGDCYLTKTSVIGCPGRTRHENGIKVSWGDFITMMNAKA